MNEHLGKNALVLSLPLVPGIAPPGVAAPGAAAPGAAPPGTVGSKRNFYSPREVKSALQSTWFLCILRLGFVD